MKRVTFSWFILSTALSRLALRADAEEIQLMVKARVAGPLLIASSLREHVPAILGTESSCS